MPTKRDPKLIQEMKRLIGEGCTNPEIAEKMGLTRAQVAVAVQRELGGNPNYRKQTVKYDKEFTLKFLKYYKKHSHKECAEKFGLSLQEVKSVLHGCYKKAQPYKDIRKAFKKDKRRKDKWTKQQINEMLCCVGLLPRSEIARRIGRGNERVIKEKLQNLGTKYPKYLNGLTLSKFRATFNCEPDVWIQTKAGPGRGKNESTFFRIVPWVWIEVAIEIGHLGAADAIKKWVYAMADFQRSVHGQDVYGSLSKVIPLEHWMIRSES